MKHCKWCGADFSSVEARIDHEMTCSERPEAKAASRTQAGDTLVKTEAKNLKDKKAAVVQIDYVVRSRSS